MTDPIPYNGISNVLGERVLWFKEETDTYLNAGQYWVQSPISLSLVSHVGTISAATLPDATFDSATVWRSVFIMLDYENTRGAISLNSYAPLRIYLTDVSAHGSQLTSGGTLQTATKWGSAVSNLASVVEPAANRLLMSATYEILLPPPDLGGPPFATDIVMNVKILDNSNWPGFVAAFNASAKWKVRVLAWRR